MSLKIFNCAHIENNVTEKLFSFTVIQNKIEYFTIFNTLVATNYQGKLLSSKLTKKIFICAFYWFLGIQFY